MDGSDEEPGSCRGDGLLEVLGEASIAVEPCQRALDHPAARQHFKAFGGVGPFDDLDGPLADAAQSILEFVSGIAAIGEDVAQPREAFDDVAQDERRPVAVLDVGSVDHGVDEIALGVGEDVALAPLDLLTRVVAPRSAGFRGFHALAVDHAGTGRGFAALRFARRHQQRVVDPQPQAIVAPQVEPAPHRRDRRKARRQHPPRQTAAQQVQDRLDNPPHRPLARPPDMRRRRQQRLQHRPFRVRQIAWQSQPGSRMKGASGISPHR